MKSIFLLLAGFASSAYSLTLVCPTYNNLIISGLSLKAQAVNIRGYIGPDWKISAQKDGDCTGRTGYVCFQEGQFMLNIPKDLASGKVKTAKVWLNEDTDDNDSHDRMGTQYGCETMSDYGSLYSQTMDDTASARLAKMLNGWYLECTPTGPNKENDFSPLIVNASDVGGGQTLLYVDTANPDLGFSASGNYYEVNYKDHQFTIKDGDDDWNILTFPEFDSNKKRSVEASFVTQHDDGSFTDRTALACRRLVE